jgi:glycosyltransferase involved in cell wall biosynthesis
MPRRFALVALNQLDPYFRDGGSRSAVNYMRTIQSQGGEVCVLSFVCQDYKAIQFADVLADPWNLVKSDAKTRVASYQGIEFVQTILPVSVAEQNTRQAIIIQAILKELKQRQVEFVLTLGEGYVPLLAGWLQRLPGAHIFQSPHHVASFIRNPTYQQFLLTRLAIANSEFMKDRIEKELGCRAYTWHPPHDLTPYCPNSARSRTYTIGFSSSQGAVKGDDLFAEIIARLPEYHFVIAGGKFSRRDLVSPNVTYLGHVQKMLDFYRQIDLLIVPSIWEEAFGLVILEAVAHGLPVIANRRGGIPEALGDSGILIDFDPDPTQLGECADRYALEIRRLLSDASLYATYRQKALARARKYEQEKATEASRIFGLFGQTGYN